MSPPLVVLVGESNPYGADPRNALLNWPRTSAGSRLQRLVLGLPENVYLSERIERGNLCAGPWSMPRARAQAAKVIEHRRGAVVVMLGRKVATAFARAGIRPPGQAVTIPEPFSMVHSSVGTFVSLPHPSGLCRIWDEPGAFERARTILREAAPHLPWGSL